MKQATAAVRQLNAELNKLRNRSANLRVNASQLNRVNQQITALNRNMAALGRHQTSLRINTGNITRTLAMINRLRAAAGTPININVNTRRTTTGGGGGGYGGGGGGGGHGGAGRLAGGLLTGVGGAFTLHQIGAAVGRAMKEGIQDVDIGETSLNMKQLDRVYGHGAEQAARDAIIEQSRRQAATSTGAFFNLGQRTQSFSEALGVTSMKKGAGTGEWDLRAATYLSGEMESFTEILVSLGKNFDDAREQAISYGKGMEQAGRMTDKFGDFDIVKATKSFDYLRQLMPTIGKEMTGDFVKNMIKYMSSTKYPASDRALGAVLLMGEEMGTRAAVGYNQAVKQLSGQNVDKIQLANQIAAGLTQTEMRTMPGKKKPQPYVTGVVDEALLQEDAPQWVRKHLLPRLEKEGQDAAKALAKKEKRTLTDYEIEDAGKKWAADAGNVNKFTAKYVSERTAREAVAAMLYRGDEIQRQLNETALRSGSKEDARAAHEFNVTRATVQMKNQMQGVAGELLKTVAPIMVPAMQTLSDSLRTKGEQLRTGQLKPGQFMEDLGKELAPFAASASIMAMGSTVGGPWGAVIRGLGGAAFAITAAAHEWMSAANIEKLLAGKDPYKTPSKAETEFKLRDQAYNDAVRDLNQAKADLAAERTRVPGTAGKRVTQAKLIKDLENKILRLEQRLHNAARQAVAADEALKEQLKRDVETFAQTAARRAAEGGGLIGPPVPPPKKPIPILPAPKVPLGTTGDPFTVQPLPGSKKVPDPASPEGQRRYWTLPRDMSWPGARFATPLGPPAGDGKPIRVIPVTKDNRPFEGDITPPTPGTTMPPPLPGSVPPVPSFLQRFHGQDKVSAADIIDPTTVASLFTSTWSTGVTELSKSGPTIGTKAADSLEGRAQSIGGAIGGAIAARVQGIKIGVDMPTQHAKANTGAIGTPT